MAVIETHIVPDNIGSIRLYDFACKVFSMIPSRKGIKKAILRGEIIVDNKKSTTGLWLKSGQKIELLESEINPPKNYRLKIEVVYEDDYLAVINKPAGITVSGNQYRTLQNAIIGNISLSKQKDALKWPKPVHRIDNQTSGLLIFAKTTSSLIELGNKFQKKEIHKIYAAVVIGNPPEKGIINSKIDGLVSKTEYKLIHSVPSLRNKYLSLLHLFPETGRTHQIRIHLSELGYPILGDKLYGKEGEILKNKGLFLCAVGLNLHHPITGIRLNLRIDEPLKFDSFLKREERRWNKYN